MAIIEPKCDKCGGIGFDIHSTDPDPPTTYVLASDYFKGLGEVQSRDLVIRYHHYVAKCKKCGEEYHYTLPY